MSTPRARRILRLIFFAVCSFALMLFATRSSFLYPMNNWDDSNSYFSMGKSMFHGTVIYRDIFDQKGPYLYFLYGLASLVSRTTFRGVFLLEVILGILDLAGIWRILKLYMKDRLALVLTPITLALMISSTSFYWGGCAEELCMPALIWTLVLTFQWLKSAQTCGSGRKIQLGNLLVSFAPCPQKTVFLVGLMCGYVACLKFTQLGFFFAFMVLVMFSSGSILRFLKSCGIFLAAMAIPFLPWLIYFALIGGLEGWYNAYIYTNVFLYSTFGAADKGEDLWTKVYELTKILYWLFWDNLQYFLFIALGILGALARKGVSLVEHFAPMILFGFTFLGIYIGGAHLPYYAFPLSAFTVTGMISAGKILEWSGKKLLAGRKAAAGAHRLPLLLAAVVLLSTGIVYGLTPNRYFLSYEAEDVFLTRFAADIAADQETEHTLLNYNCLDCGLYTAADIYPTCYWFQTQTLPDSNVVDEQHRYIMEGKTGFLVCRDLYPPFVSDHYEMIDEFHQVMGDVEHDYYLFRRVK